MKKLLFEALKMIVIILSSIFLVEWASEGTLAGLFEHPFRFIGTTLLLGFLGGFLTVKVLEKTPKE